MADHFVGALLPLLLFAGAWLQVFPPLSAVLESLAWKVVVPVADSLRQN